MARFDFDLVEEKAGHQLTFLGHGLGISKYFCERCGALMFERNLELILFHTAHLTSTLERCTGEATDQPTLKSKLEILQAQDYERLRRI